MIRSLFILLLLCTLSLASQGQAITVDDLLAVSSLSAKSVGNYMNKKGFKPVGRSMEDSLRGVSYFQKPGKVKDTVEVFRSLDMYRKEDLYFYALHTTSVDEYVQGKDRLKKAGFFYDKGKDTATTAVQMFQDKNITVIADSSRDESGTQYNFVLQKRILPDRRAIRFADDLLLFDSHEFLASFFGANNVRKDVYYFTDNEMKKCSILFGNTDHQAIFVWDDEADYRKLAYILISGVTPTPGGAQYTGAISLNKWVLKNGLYSGMSLKELLKLNGSDFSFYGRNSEFSYLIDPKQGGTIDFKKTGVMLGCLNCKGVALLDGSRVSAATAVEKDLFIHIFYIMVRP